MGSWFVVEQPSQLADGGDGRFVVARAGDYVERRAAGLDVWTKELRDLLRASRTGSSARRARMASGRSSASPQRAARGQPRAWRRSRTRRLSRARSRRVSAGVAGFLAICSTTVANRLVRPRSRASRRRAFRRAAPRHRTVRRRRAGSRGDGAGTMSASWKEKNSPSNVTGSPPEASAGSAGTRPCGARASWGRRRRSRFRVCPRRRCPRRMSACRGPARRCSQAAAPRAPGGATGADRARRTRATQLGGQERRRVDQRIRTGADEEAHVIADTEMVNARIGDASQRSTGRSSPGGGLAERKKCAHAHGADTANPLTVAKPVVRGAGRERRP